MRNECKNVLIDIVNKRQWTAGIKGHISRREWEGRERKDPSGKKRAHSGTPNGVAFSRCRARYLELAAVMEKDSGGVYDGGKGSLENLTKQRIDLVTEQLAGDRSNQNSGGSSYRRMKLVHPRGVTERVEEVGMLENLTRRPRQKKLKFSRAKKIEKESGAQIPSGIEERWKKMDKGRKG